MNRFNIGKPFSTAGLLSMTLICLANLLPTGNAAAEGIDSASVLQVKEVEQLAFPGRCDGTAEEKLVYEVRVADNELDGKLKFYAKGPRGTNQKLEIADLLDGEVKLKSLTLSGRSGDGYTKRGLWVQHVGSGEKRQLSYIPGQFRCNTKGIITMRYNNIWVKVIPFTSTPIADR
ncbi:MAG: hypothetical protein AAF431_04910 [Pseudomonadota bacterium]